MRIYFSSFLVIASSVNIRVLALTILTVAIFSITSCKEDPTLLGRSILPVGDDLIVRIDSSTFISAHTITGKHIVTSLNSYHVLGSMEDSIFGKSSAGFVTQYIPSILVSPSAVLGVDSMILTLAIAGYYGDSVMQQNIYVYELTDELSGDSLYFSDFDPTGKYNSVPLGAATFSPKDSLITIKLTDTDFLNRFINQNDSVYTVSANFLKVFKGLYIKTDEVTVGGGYAIINSLLLSSRLDMHYTYGTGLSTIYTMNFVGSITKFNVFSHDYTSYPVNVNLNNSASNDSVLFVEGLAGVTVNLKFPSLDTFLTNKKVVINKASLIIPVENIVFGNLAEKTIPSRLILFKIEPTGSYQYLSDYIIGSTYFNGSYDVNKKAYIFNISLHIQSYLNRKSENSELILASFSSNESPNRVVLKGAGGSNSKIKLIVTYTELK